MSRLDRLSLRKAAEADLPAVLDILARAFEQDAEAELVRAILSDPTAVPTLSLIAEAKGHALGHILFSRVRLGDGLFSRVLLGDGTEDASAAILAPLAVLPEAQGRGVGQALVEEGLGRLRAAGTILVFVLGDPAYYRRFGFAAAGAQGFEAPYPIAAAHAEAWMVQTLGADLPALPRGRIICCDALMSPELWQA